MFNKMAEFLLSSTPGAAINDEKDWHSYIGLSAAGLASAATHVMLLAFFIVHFSFWQIVLNSASILLTLAALRLNKHRKYLLSGLTITADIFAYTFLSVLFFGNANYTFLYFFSLMVIQLIIQYTEQNIRNIITAVLWVFMLLCLFIAGRRTPIMTDYTEAHYFLQVLNISITAFAIVCSVSLTNVINSLAAAVTSKKIDDLTDQALTDPLTQLFNRRYAEEIFTMIKEDQSGRRWCFAMLDVDDFKVVNDTFGHSTGDRLLANLASFISGRLRQTDILIRWGGEEFLIILENVTVSAAFSIIEKLRVAISREEFVSVPKSIYITVTAGISSVDRHDISASINSCDKKLYEGKNIGKNISII